MQQPLHLKLEMQCLLLELEMRRLLLKQQHLLLKLEMHRLLLMKMEQQRLPKLKMVGRRGSRDRVGGQERRGR